MIAVALSGALCESAFAGDEPPTIEVFADSTFQQEAPGVENVTVYVIDRIERLQQQLSQGLPRDPESAKQEVIQRFQGLDTHLSRQLENAAIGLLKAQRYGIDRYPAMVFEGRAVVYGVVDLGEATGRYRQWQLGTGR
ncbi:MAG: TIGR03757 family integrating conjugative element protein [Gammaproteobacteria bacterium]|nr:TIGR03757 family integrating conjugative element protein [Gammaproteobacteria bacterium]